MAEHIGFHNVPMPEFTPEEGAAIRKFLDAVMGRFMYFDDEVGSYMPCFGCMVSMALEAEPDFAEDFEANEQAFLSGIEAWMSVMTNHHLLADPVARKEMDDSVIDQLLGGTLYEEGPSSFDESDDDDDEGEGWKR